MDVILTLIVLVLSVLCACVSRMLDQMSLAPVTVGLGVNPWISQEVRDRKRVALDNFLSCCELSPVKNTLSANWDDCSDRTKQAIHAEDGASDAASVLGPSQPQELKLAYIKVKQTVVVPEPKGQQLFEALVQTYNRVNSWDSRRQMLSIMADTQSGRDSSPSAICDSVSLRSCIQISQLQVDHFLSFVMSPHICKTCLLGKPSSNCLMVAKFRYQRW